MVNKLVPLYFFHNNLSHRYPSDDEYVHTTLPDRVHSSHSGSLGCNLLEGKGELYGLSFDGSRCEEASWDVQCGLWVLGPPWGLSNSGLSVNEIENGPHYQGYGTKEVEWVSRGETRCDRGDMSD
jgi:hypothetical protein